jgi:hemolysin III
METVGRIPQSERINVATAALGLAAAIAGAALLLLVASRQADGWRLGGAIAFAASLCALHLASTLYHAAAEPTLKRRLKMLDHCTIYLLIAGTYTPFTLIGLRGTLGWQLFAAIWALAAAGIAFKLVSRGRLRLLSTVIYVAMGWLVLIAIRPVAAALDGWTFGWLLAGGIAYTVGALFYQLRSLPYSHAIWHLFVIAGGACHYIAVLAQVAGSR